MKNASSTHILIQHIRSFYGRLESADANDAPLWLNLFVCLGRLQADITIPVPPSVFNM